MLWASNHKMLATHKAFTLIELVLTIILILSLSGLSYHFWFKPSSFLSASSDELVIFFNLAQRISKMTESEVKIDFVSGEIKLYIKPLEAKDYTEYKKIVLPSSFEQKALLSKERVQFPIYYIKGDFLGKEKVKVERNILSVNGKNIIIEGLSGVAYASPTE